MVQYPSSSHWPCFVRNCCQSSPILHDGSFISVWKEMKIQSLSASDTLLHRVRQMSAKKIHKRKSSEHTFFIYINYLSYIQLSIYRHMKHKIREKRKSMFILNICHFAGGRKQESREILSKLADSRHTLANCNCTCFKMSFSKLNIVFSSKMRTPANTLAYLLKCQNVFFQKCQAPDYIHTI